MNLSQEQQFKALLDYLKQSRGFDFAGYKPPSLMRRVERRMQQVSVASFGDYMDYLEVHPDEFSALFNSILINVTSFFRDTATWEYVAQDVLPAILRQQDSEAPIRVWSAGCASGEEPYTLAMLLIEALGPDAFRERVKIYATDIDEEALNEARLASYTARQISGVPQPLLEKYFDASANRYTVSKELRRAVIFGRHDLLKDAPISRVDLLVCRNTLMYFNSERQSEVMDRFHFALNDKGFLVLGKAEMLFGYVNRFTPLDLKRRIFTRTGQTRQRDRTPAAERINAPVAMVQPDGPLDRLREQALDTAPIAQVVIEADNTVVAINESARALFRLSVRDVGRPLQDLEISYRPLELRSCIEQAFTERRAIEIKDAVWSGIANAEQQSLDIHVLPFWEEAGMPLGVTVTFTDVTRYTRLHQRLEEANRQLETAYEELQSTNEELETTNEELQSTVEELETTNEELQSTNEELETMNEELQSTNEELQTINEELQTRSWELNQTNGFFNSILSSLSAGVIVVNRELIVQVWNQQSEEFWGVRTEEAQDKHLMALDIGLPLEEIRASIRTVLNEGRPSRDILVDATNRRGRAIRCRILCTPLVGTNQEILGVIILAEEPDASPLVLDGAAAPT